MLALHAHTFQIIVLLVALQRVLELFLSKHNQKWLLTQGAVEQGHEHYPLMVAVHTLWLLALLLAPFYWTTPQVSPALQWIFLGLFLAGQALRLGAILSLGKHWTTTVMVIPGKPLVSRGLYRFLRHPNYWGVVLEIFALPMVWGLWPLAGLFSALNLGVLALRLKVEERALAPMRQT